LLAVGLATDYELHIPGFISQCMQEVFSKACRQALGPTQPPIQWVPAFFPAREAAGARCWPLANI